MRQMAFLIFSLLGLHGVLALAAPQKTLCSITINSNNELTQFKKNLDPKIWNFVELTENGGNGEDGDDADWFAESCRKKISCDILLISGEFAGTFFGTTKFKLPLTQLETYSCNTDCKGIIEQPKEVFLFGCNTLAGKEKDLRTPEQYLQVLLDHGFSSVEAQSVVAFRYSIYGSSYSSRMTQVFSKTPRIYGFSSVGPAGEHVEGELASYLQKNREGYRDFDQMNNSLQTAKNQSLMKALSDTAIVQEQGFSFYSKAAQTKPYCYIADRNVSRLQKLQYFKKQLESIEGARFVPYIQDFLSTLQLQKPLSSEEREVLSEIRDSQKVRDTFERILAIPGDLYLVPRASIYNLMLRLKMVSEAKFRARALEVLDINFNQPISIVKKDNVCALNIKGDVDIQKIPEARWQEATTFQLLYCLEPRIEVTEKVLQALSSSNRELNLAATRFVTKLKVTDTRIQEALLKKLSSANSDEIIQSSALALRQVGPARLEVSKQLLEVLKTSRISVKRDLIYTIGYQNITSPEIELSLAHLLDENMNLDQAIGFALERLRGNFPEVRQFLLQRIQSDDVNMRWHAGELIGYSKIQDESIRQVASKLLSSSQYEDQRSAIYVFWGMGTENREDIRRLLTIATGSDGRVDEAADSAFRGLKPSPVVDSVLLEALQQNQPHSLNALIRLAGTLHAQNPALRAILLGYLNGSNESAAGAAAVAFGKVGSLTIPEQMALARLALGESYTSSEARGALSAAKTLDSSVLDYLRTQKGESWMKEHQFMKD